jgi:hypothetical protein
MEVDKKDYKLIVAILNFIHTNQRKDYTLNAKTIKSLKENVKEKNKFTTNSLDEAFSYLKM